MKRRAVRIAAATALLPLSLLPAQTASAHTVRPQPLYLSDYSVGIAPPTLGPSCDLGSQLNCGFVIVSANFQGLDGRGPRPTNTPEDGDLTGTVRVTRTYGCQQPDGKRLKGFTRKISEIAPLETRRAFGYSIPAAGNTLSVSTFAFLLDNQPGNCPAGTQPRVYRIRAHGAKLVLRSDWAPVPSKNYSAPARAEWRGSVPTPSPEFGF
jgi:hypothetical protein